jgi:hypothetical protein
MREAAKFLALLEQENPGVAGDDRTWPDREPATTPVSHSARPWRYIAHGECDHPASRRTGAGAPRFIFGSGDPVPACRPIHRPIARSTRPADPCATRSRPAVRSCHRKRLGPLPSCLGLQSDHAMECPSRWRPSRFFRARRCGDSDSRPPFRPAPAQSCREGWGSWLKSHWVAARHLPHRTPVRVHTRSRGAKRRRKRLGELGAL